VSCDNQRVAKILKRLPRDVNARAIAVARAAIGEADENIDPRPIEAIAKSGEKASKGGQARAATLTSPRKRQIAKRAAAARWKPKST
jgi:hypothetical protein